MSSEKSKKTRYSDSELEEFKMVIEQKIAIAKEELHTLSATLNLSDSGVTHQTLEDGAATLELESTN